MDSGKEQAKFVLEQKVRAVMNYATTDMMDTLVMVKGKQRLNEEQKAEYIKAGKRLLDLANDMVREAERRVRSTDEEPEQRVEAPAKWNVIEQGAAYKGNIKDVVYVKVSSRPYLHESQRGTWSWRTTVDGHEGYRHVSVSKLYCVVQDPADNSIYVGVDSTWQTDQPVFKDVCNKPVPHGETRGGTWMMQHSDNRWP